MTRCCWAAALVVAVVEAGSATCVRDDELAARCKSWAFIHIPKCGGTTIATMANNTRIRKLQQPYQNGMHPPTEPMQHVLAAYLQSRIGVPAWRRAYTFAVVRNPYDWALSQRGSGVLVRASIAPRAPGSSTPPRSTAPRACSATRTRRTRRRASSSPTSSTTRSGAPRTARRSPTGRSTARSSRPTSPSSTRSRAQAADNGTKPGSLQWRRRGFLAGNRVATELRARSQSRHKETSQRAWLTDDDDGRLLVDRVVKLEDEAAYATVATEAGLLEELCGAPPCDRGAEAPAWLKAVHHGRRHLYYDDLSCEIVARRFAVDFAEFGYDIDDCYGTRG